MTRPIHVTLVADDPEVQARFAELLAQIQAIAPQAAPVPAPEPQATFCTVCSHGCDPREARRHARLGATVCPLCHQTAERVHNQYLEDARRHQSDFIREFRTMVRDVRGGAELPTFYRGFA